MSKSSWGQITQGIAPNTLVRKVVKFVRTELPDWRDRPNRPVEFSEERLNAQLCKHLNSRARHSLKMVQFHHEEKQTGRGRVDVSAGLTEDGFIGSTFYTIFDPFIVFEGKRLPPPKANREWEYVTGFKSRKGGIQRFKLGLHGAHCEVSVMIGYIQDGAAGSWFIKINSWIRALSADASLDGSGWDASEQLTDYTEDLKTRSATSTSTHPREQGCVSDSIQLHHLWIDLTDE